MVFFIPALITGAAAIAARLAPKIIFPAVRAAPRVVLTAVKAIPRIAGKVILPITFKKVALTATGIGILQVSPIARKFVVARIKDPTATGREIGAIIEDPSKLQPDIEKGETTIEKIKEIGKKAGVVGGAAAITAAAIAAIRKVRKEKVPIPSLPLPTALFQGIPIPTPTIEPIGVVEKPVEKPIEVVPKAAPAIKNIFKPEVNVKVSHSKRFINQQILVRG